MKVTKTHLITDDGVTELTVVTFSPDELSAQAEAADPKPKGLDTFRPDYEVYEN